jgi:hypothetical protein
VPTDYSRFLRPTRPSLARPFSVLDEREEEPAINYDRFRTKREPEKPTITPPGTFDSFERAAKEASLPVQTPRRRANPFTPQLPELGITDLVSREDRPDFSIGGALEKGAMDPGTAEGRALRDREVQARYDQAERAKRMFNDIAFTLPQAAAGAGRNVAAKADAILPGELGDETAGRIRRGLDDVSARMMEEGGVIKVPVPTPWGTIEVNPQVASNLVGNIASEVALFRGMGRAVSKAAQGAANVDKATGISTTFGRAGGAFDRLSKAADAERGIRGVGMRTGRDFLANLPLNLLNASDRELSAAGGFAELGKMAGGDTTTGKTGFFERASRDPLGRVGVELGLDAIAGGAVEGGLEAFRWIRDGSAPSRGFQLGGEIDRAAKRAQARRLAGDTYIPSPESQTRVVVDGVAARKPTTPEATPATPDATPEPPPVARGPRPALDQDDQVAARGWALGRPTLLRFGQGIKHQGRFALVTLDELVPSHDPFSYQPDPRYPQGVQGRSYDRDPGAQAANQQKAAELDPDALLDPSFSPEKGPPIITRDGIVVSGNDRTMAMKRAREQFPERFAAYRQRLLEDAAAYGIDIPPGAFDDGKVPVLVRVLDDANVDELDPATLRTLNAASDATETKMKAKLDEAATKADALRQSRAALDHLTNTLDPEETLAEYLKGANGRVFVQRLVEDGVISPAELGRYVDLKTNALTEAGRDLLRDTLLVAAVRDTDAISRAPASIVAKLEGAAAPMMRVQGTEWDLSETVSAALDQLAKAKANGLNVDQALAQLSLTDAPIPSNVTTMMRFLADTGKRRVTEVFREYARLAADGITRSQSDDLLGGAGIVGGSTPDEVFRLQFGGEAAPTIDVGGTTPGGVAAEPDLFGGAVPDDQTALFGDEVGKAARKPMTTPGGGGPELPGKITPDEMAARRDELGAPKQEVRGADDPGQQTLLDPSGTETPAQLLERLSQNSDGTPPPRPDTIELETAASPNAPKAVSIAGVDDVATRLNAASDARRPIESDNQVKAFPDWEAAKRATVDASGKPIPKGIEKALVRELGVGAAGAVAGAAAGDDFNESVALGTAGFLAGFAGAKAGKGVFTLAKMAAEVRKEMQTPQVQSLQAMVKQLGEAFDVHTRSGMRHWLELKKKDRASALGYFSFKYDKGQRIVRLRSAAQFLTMAHEIGHAMHLDWEAAGNDVLEMLRARGINEDKAMEQLLGLGKALYGEGYQGTTYLREGFAEWTRRYIRGQDELLEQITPEAHRAALQLLSSNPKRLTAIEESRKLYAAYVKGTPYDRAAAQMAGFPRKRKFVDTVRNWFDREIDSRKAMVSLGLDPDVKPGALFKDNAYARRRLAARANAEAQHALTTGVSDDLTGKHLTRPLQSVFEALDKDEYKTFQEYLYAERTLELLDRRYTAPDGTIVRLPPVNSGMSFEDAFQIVAENRATYQPLAEIIWEHQAAILDLRVRVGAMTAAEAAFIKQTNQKHVPLYRVFDDETTRVKGSGPANDHGSSGLPRIKGSDRMIEPPLESIINDTFRTYNFIRRHEALVTLVKNQQEAPVDGAGRVIAILPYKPTITKKLKINAADAARQLEAMGWPGVKDLENVPGFEDIKQTLEDLNDAEVIGWQSQEKKLADSIDRRELIAPVIIKGKRQWVQFRNADLYDAYMGSGGNTGVDAWMGSAIGGAFKASTDLFRQSATLTPSFIKRNPVRDAWGAMIRTNKEGVPILGEHFIRGLGVLIDHYANTPVKYEPLPPPGASRVLEQLRRQGDAGLRRALRNPLASAAAGAGVGYSQGDTTDESLAFAGIGGLIGLGGGLAAKGGKIIDQATGVETDLYEMWIQRGGGGVTLAGSNMTDPQRAIAEMLPSPTAKRLLITHPIQALRFVAQVSETVTRLGEMQIVMRQQLKKGASLGDAKIAALMAAAEITQDFTKGGRLAMALNQVLPFFNASIVGKGDLVRDVQDPRRVRRMIGGVMGPSIALWMLQRDDPEYQDIPPHDKDDGWNLVWPPKFIRDHAEQAATNPDYASLFPEPIIEWLKEQHEQPTTRFKIPKPFERGVLFGSAIERMLEGVVRMTDDDPATQAGDPGAGYKLGDMLLNLVATGSAPPAVGTLWDIAWNEDFAGRPIVPDYLENRPAEERGSSRVGETARLLARGTGISSGVIDYAATGIAGPLAQVPLNIADNVIREARDMMGKEPMREPPRGGFTATPQSWGRAFEKGELSGTGANLSRLYERLAEAEGKWASRNKAEEDGNRERQREIEADPIVRLYNTIEKGGGRAGRLREAGKRLREKRDERREAVRRGDQERVREIDRDMTLLARTVMAEVNRARSQ